MRPKGSAPASICSPTTSPPSQIPSCTSSSQISLKAFDRHWRYGTGYTVPVLIASGNSSPRVTSALKTFTFGGKPLTPSPARPPTNPILTPPRTSVRAQNTVEVNPWLDPARQVQPGLILCTTIDAEADQDEEIPSYKNGRQLCLR